MGSDGYKPWWAIDKAAWREKFAPFYKFTSITDGRDAPLPPWSEADVQEFIKSDPVHGPRLALVRQGATIAAIGAVTGGVATAAISYRYSKSGVGMIAALVGGTVFSWAIAEEEVEVREVQVVWDGQKGEEGKSLGAAAAFGTANVVELEQL